MQCILYKIYFWKVFHINYNWICTPICTKILFLQKVGVTMTFPETLNMKNAINELSFLLVTHTVDSDARIGGYGILKSG
jgi:hypothetical protein